MYTKQMLRKNLSEKKDSLVASLILLNRETDKSDAYRGALYPAIQIITSRKIAVERAIRKLDVEQNDFAVFMMHTIMGYEAGIGINDNYSGVFRELWSYLPIHLDFCVLANTILKTGTDTIQESYVDSFIEEANKYA